MKAVVVSVAAAVALVACGGGGSDPEMQQGLYLGKSLEFLDFPGRPASVLVLEGQEAWVLQQPTADFLNTTGLFGQGTFTHTGPGLLFTANRALVATGSPALEETPMTLGTLVGASAVSLQALVPAHPSTGRPVATLVTPATGYDYAKPARIADVSGAWNPRIAGSAFIIDDTGAITGSALANGCSMAGALAARPGGKNVFNVSFTMANCAAAGAYTGVAVTYLEGPGFELTGPFTLPTLRLMGISADKAKSFGMTIGK